MTGGLSYGLFTSGDQPQPEVDYLHFPFEEVERSLEQYRSIQKYFYGDFYPLREYTQADDAWMAYQLDLPEEEEGLIVVLKREFSNYTQAAFPLKALRTNVAYRIADIDAAESQVVLGRELMKESRSVCCVEQIRPYSVITQSHRSRTCFALTISLTMSVVLAPAPIALQFFLTHASP